MSARRTVAVALALALVGLLLPWMAGTASAHTTANDGTAHGGDHCPGGYARPAQGSTTAGTVRNVEVCEGFASHAAANGAVVSVARYIEASGGAANHSVAQYGFVIHTAPSSGFLCMRLTKADGTTTNHAASGASWVGGYWSAYGISSANTTGSQVTALVGWWSVNSGGNCTATPTFTQPVIDTIIPPPSALCPRTLSQNNGSNVATFRGSTTTQVGATVTGWSWNFGDGSPVGTTQNVQHIYALITAQPSGGWTATLTVSVAAGTGYKFTGGLSTTTVTCSVRVDFLNPLETTPGSTGVGQDDDTDCPTGFGWLNPLAILNILKCLFIPSSASVDSLSVISDGIETRAPFSYIYETVTFPGDFFKNLAYQMHPANPGCAGTVMIDPPGQTGAVYLLNGQCPNDGSDLGDVLGSTPWSILQRFFQALFLMSLAIALYQLVARLIK